LEWLNWRERENSNKKKIEIEDKIENNNTKCKKSTSIEELSKKNQKSKK